MAPFIEQHRERIIGLCKKYGITRLDVFGSAARGDFKLDTSDVDFFYEIDQSKEHWVDDWLDFISDLEALLGRRVDMVHEESAMKRPLFLQVANQNRQPLYAA